MGNTFPLRVQLDRVGYAHCTFGHQARLRLALDTVAQRITGGVITHEPRADIASLARADPTSAKSRIEDTYRHAHKDASVVELMHVLHEAMTALALDIDREPLFRVRVSCPNLPELDHAWHQDSLDLPRATRAQRSLHLSLWVALHDVGMEEGGLEVIAGSHLRPQPHHPSARSHQTISEPELGDAQPHRVATKAGAVLLLDPWLVHRTAPNTSAQARVAVVAWYAAAPC